MDDKLSAELARLAAATSRLASVAELLARAPGTLATGAAGGQSPSIPAASPGPGRASSAPPGPVGDLIRELLGAKEQHARTPGADPAAFATQVLQILRGYGGAVHGGAFAAFGADPGGSHHDLARAVLSGQVPATPPTKAPQPPAPTVNLQQAVNNLVSQAAGGQSPSPAPRPRRRSRGFLGRVGQTIGRRLARTRAGRTFAAVRSGVGRLRAAAGIGARAAAGAGGATGAAAAAGTAGVVVGGLAAAGVALYEFQKAVHAAAEANLQAQRKFAESSAAMAAVLAQLDVRQTFREMEMGNRLAPSARRLAEATDKRRESTKEVEILVQGVKNDVIGFFEGGFAKFFDAFSPLFRAINKYLGFGDEDDAKRYATAQDVLDEMDRRARGADAAGQNRLAQARLAAESERLRRDVARGVFGGG